MSRAYAGSAGVIGWPVAHSKSPLIHRFWLDRLGLDGDYGRFAVAPDRLDRAIAALPTLGLAGVNVTVPHKQAVIPLLDRIDPAAATIGAVNTIVVEDGRLAGYNSDAPGFLEPLGAIGDRAGRAVVIGAGGAARAVVHALASAGFRIDIANRDLARAERLAAELGGPGGGAMPLAALADLDLSVDGSRVNLIVNTSVLGMTGAPPLDIGLDRVAPSVIVYDIVYAPLDTPLLVAARRRGQPTVDGLSMLIGQAAVAFRHFYGVAPPRDADAALRAMLTA